ncbi:MAG: polysaccharide lyase family 8 super-sandwich domain-containing protein [Candidatus Cryptobacteroides sp.]
MKLRKIITTVGLLLCVCAASMAQSFDWDRLNAENHPRVIFTQEDFDGIRNSDNEIVSLFSSHVIAFADEALKEEDLKHELQGKRMLAVSRNALVRLLPCSYAYKLTGDEKYLEKAERDLQTVCSFEDWNPSHFLDTGEMALAVGLSYDWLYWELSDKTKDMVRKALHNLAFVASHNKKDTWFYNTNTNWNQVCNGGLSCAALAVYEDDAEEAWAVIQKAVETNRRAVETIYSPDGNYPEGYGYWHYGTTFQVILNTALETALGWDGGLSGVDGFEESGRFLLYLQGPLGLVYNYSDCGSRSQAAYGAWYFAYKYNDLSVLYLEKNRLDRYNRGYDRRFEVFDVFYAYKLNIKSLEQIQAPEEGLWSGAGSNPVVLAHSNWKMDDSDMFLGVKGGQADMSHGHMDAGSFVFDADCVRWSAELGSQNYYSIEKLNMDLWNYKPDADRWKILRYNNFNHSTLTVNDALHNPKGFTTLERVIDDGTRQGGVFDMSASLQPELKNAVRTIYLESGRLIVIDEIEARDDKDAAVRWNMVGYGQPEVLDEGMLKLSKAGKTRYLRAFSEGSELKFYGEDIVGKEYDAPVTDLFNCGWTAVVKAGKKEVFVTVIDKEKNVLDELRQAFVEAAADTCAPDGTVTENFIRYSDHGRANDVLLLQLYTSIHLPDAEVNALLDAFDFENRCWKDIDYTVMDRGRWPATLHVTRMQALAKLYVSEDSPWCHSPRLKELLHAAMAYWFENMPHNPNWWHNDIGVPKKMTTVLLMLRDELSPCELEGGLRVLERSKFGRTGQNKVWLAGNNLMKGLLTDDEGLVIRARNYIAEEIYQTDEEGIQEDWSFHQHGPQIQFGNYGLAYSEGLSFWLRVLKGSRFDFTPGQKSIAVNLLKEGICQSVYRGVMDPSYCGRQNFIDGGCGKAYALASTAYNMSHAIPEDSLFFARVANENLVPEKYGNSLVGAKFYQRSDCGIYRRPSWYASIRMHSDRTIGFEFTNKENTLANFSADGALLLMQDGKEFDNIFAYWDWRKVPGVTAYDDGGQIKCDDSVAGKKNYSSHVGGLVCGDVMLSTMELNRDGVSGLKTAFFFPDCIVNLGADMKILNPNARHFTTAVDQIHYTGEHKRGKNWLAHADRAYFSLDSKAMQCTVELQKGRWDDIDPAFHDRYDEGKVFKCWFEHSLTEPDSYAYMILPCTSSKEAAAYAKKLSKGKAELKLVRNDAKCQAVLYGRSLCAVFHEAGEYRLGKKKIVVDSPCLYVDDGEKVVKEKLAPRTVTPMDSLMDKVFDRAEKQFLLMDENLSAKNSAEAIYPRSLDGNGELVTSGYKWWCSGFFPGSLWLVYDYGRNGKIKALAEKYSEALEALKYRTDDHDVGFQLMCSFGNALRISGDKKYEDILVAGAKSLGSRFNPNVGCTRSWDWGKWKFPVIIDNMMNMELLLKAAQLSGDAVLRDVALSHARTTMKNHFRENYSSWHLVDYDPQNGKVVHKQTVQGYADSSSWSRGQAWGVYAYTMMYRYTGDKAMLEHAEHIADYIIPKLPADGVPYWDFCAPNIPLEERDASAGAVIASALVELSDYVGAQKSKTYLTCAENILRSLAGDEYLAAEGEIQGFLLKHSVGNKAGKSEVDVPLSYADYYFLEALLRYRERMK